jgi:3-dehydroquinate synthase
MKTLSYRFSGSSTEYYLGESLSRLEHYADPDQAILVMDETVSRLHGHRVKGWRQVVIPSGEDHKSLDDFQTIIDQLIKLQADRKTILIAIGGGMVTDISGFAAAVYLRGIRFAAVPTTLLAQVDAAIGGKNGINYGQYKNILGTTRQPEFILFDPSLLESLPRDEWSNGFAEIIKYGCILDAELFRLLEQRLTLGNFADPEGIGKVVERCVILKSDVVKQDEFELGKRRLLNFGHTVGHAVEKLYHLSHGRAVSIGMVAAVSVSRQLSGFSEISAGRVTRLLQGFGLPVEFDFDPEKVVNHLTLDKKRDKDSIHFVLLLEIGEAVTQLVLIGELKQLLTSANIR